MAYIYQITFDIHSDQMNELQIGSSLERTLGYLRTLLPSEPGYITIRVARSVNSKDDIHLLVESEWDTWQDLERHSDSSLAENKVLQEFEPHVELEDLEIHLFEEVA
jgi:heme-degrading monooxygenase HmoA